MGRKGGGWSVLCDDTQPPVHRVSAAFTTGSTVAIKTTHTYV